MRLHRLEIEGYRGFEHKVIIDFPEGNTPMVLVGVNGSGKTAVLDVIAKCLQRIVYILTKCKKGEPSLYASGQENIDINNNADSAECILTWKTESASEITGFRLKRSSSLDCRESIGDNKIGQWLRANINMDRDKEFNTYFFYYYSTLRTVSNPTMNSKDISLLNQCDAWRNDSSISNSFQTFFEWFRNREDIENEKFKRNGREAPTDSYLDIQLETVRKAISSIIDNFSNPYIKRTFPPGFIIDKDGQELSLNQLSYGEKMLLALVGDIARRLALANPSLENPLEGKGVILIDEVDLHLHPSWQRTIVNKLTKTFPNIQFIVTTHSELVISHVKKESIFVLKDNQVIPWKEQAFNPYGAEPEDVLKIIQGVDEVLPDEVTNKFKQLFDLIDKDDFEAAKRLKHELEELVDMQHPSLLRAETNMELKTLIG